MHIETYNSAIKLFGLDENGGKDIILESNQMHRYGKFTSLALNACKSELNRSITSDNAETSFSKTISYGMVSPIENQLFDDKENDAEICANIENGYEHQKIFKINRTQRVNMQL
jgi:hypothetical protein